MTSGRPHTSPVQTFVRNAWIVLGAQLVAAALAVGVTAWAAFSVRPLLSERERLSREVRNAQNRMVALAAEEDRTRRRIEALQRETATLSAELEGARRAIPS